MRDDVAYDISELYPERPVDDLHLARLRRRIFDEPPRQRRSREWTGAAAAAVVAVLIGSFVLLQRGPDPFQTGAPLGSLWEAADRLEESGPPAGKYRHLHYTIWETMVVEHGDDTWQADAREYAFDVWLPTENGQEVTFWKLYTGRTRQIAGQHPVGEESFDMLETPILWGTHCATTPCREKSFDLPLTVDPKTKLDSASSRLLSPFSTNREKAATFRELASEPAIRYSDGTVAVDGGKTRFTIDPGTGQVTGSEERQVGPGRLPEGTVRRSVTITEEWTDQRPS